MKSFLTNISFAFLFICLSATCCFAQTEQPDPQIPHGMRILKTTTKTQTIQVKVSDMKTDHDATVLSTAFSEKENVVSCSCDISKGMCTVEILKTAKLEDLKDVVSFTGLTMGKEFED